MADVAIVIGHHEEAKGATLALGSHTIQEYDFWSPFAHELALTLQIWGHEAAVVERPSAQPDRELAQRVHDTSADAAIELPFNASRDATASGTEMLYWHSSTEGRRLTDKLQGETVSVLQTRDRGTKGRGRQKTWPFLRYTEMPAVICEPAFATNERDRWKLLTRQMALMAAYRRAILDWL